MDVGIINPIVSINICARNEELYIKDCLDSLLSQTFNDFEIIIVNDASSDRTLEIINEFQDDRIKCITNKECLGIAKSRNKAIMHSKGKYIFCTDADCTVNKTWIKEGLSCFEANYIGVEGSLIYVSENYQPTFSTGFMENRTGKHFMTGNVAYTKEIIEAVGGFNENLSSFVDRDLGLKVTQLGKVVFNKKMIVLHPLVLHTSGMLMRFAKRIEGRVYLFKRFGDRICISWRVMKPFNLAKILCPPLILLSLFTNRFKNNEDYKLLPFTYLFAVLERFYIWRACVKYRVFLI